MFKNKIWLLILLLVIFLLIFINKKDNQEVLVGNDRDQHNCIGSAGYSWCENKNKCYRPFEEFCLDEEDKIINSIEEETNLSFNYLGEESFDWHFNQGKIVSIQGYSYSIENLNFEDYQKIENYINRNYEIDIDNLADGVSGSLRGFYNNYMVCVLNSEIMETKENESGLLEPVDGSMKVKLICGYFNKNNYN